MPLALTVNQRYALAVPTDPDSIARNERGTGTSDDLLRSLYRVAKLDYHPET